jgi:hypothetical protein
MHPLGEILSIATGRLLSRSRIEGVYRILNDMTGDNLMTHQLPRAADACKPALLAQHPQLVGVEPPQFVGVGPTDLMAWLADAEQRYGTELPVTPLPDWERRNPIEELCDMVGSDRVVVAVVPEVTE